MSLAGRIGTACVRSPGTCRRVPRAFDWRNPAGHRIGAGEGVRLAAFQQWSLACLYSRRISPPCAPATRTSSSATGDALPSRAYVNAFSPDRVTRRIAARRLPTRTAREPVEARRSGWCHLSVSPEVTEQASARAVALQMLGREFAGVETATAADAASAGERVFAAVSVSLMQWIGPDGSQALVTRALGLAQAHRPALKAIPPPDQSALVLQQLAATVDPQDTNAVMDAAAMILTTLIELLGRLIGNDLAIRLIGHDSPDRGAAHPRPGAGMEGSS